jgi:hypothetical protein
MSNVLRNRDRLAELTLEETALSDRLSKALKAHTDFVQRYPIPARFPDYSRELKKLEAGMATIQRELTALKRVLLGIKAEIKGAELAAETNLAAETGVPLLLFPWRIETRYADLPDGSVELKIRVLPDDIQVDSHVTGFSEEELQAGATFRTESAAGDAARRKAWVKLAERFGAQRAGYIVQASEGKAADPKRGAARARLLPDRWVALGYRGEAEVMRAWSGKVNTELATGLDASGESPLIDAQGLPALDAGLKWLIDFGAAEAAGMALRHSFKPGEQTQLDTLLVLGARLDRAPTQTKTDLEQLFAAHRHTSGVAFLPQGTPTNNVAGPSSAYSKRDAGFERSYSLEAVDAPALSTASDGARLAASLGIETSTLQRVDGAGSREDSEARDMATGLWPATWGYFLEHLVPEWIAAPFVTNLAYGRAHFIAHVRARGPLAAIRIGAQPYGILPVTSAGPEWKPDDPRDAATMRVLSVLRKSWQEAAARLPRAADGADGENSFLNVLRTEAVSSRYDVRGVMGKRTSEFFWRASGGPAIASPSARALRAARAVLRQLGLTIPEHLGAFVFAETARLLDLDALLTKANAFATLDAATAAKLVSDARAGLSASGLMAALATHAHVLQLTRTAELLLQRDGVAAAPPLAELRGIETAAEAPASWARLDMPLPKTAAGTSVMLRLDTAPALATTEEERELNELRAATKRLAALPAARVHLLEREVLDLSAHRLDAWLTSFASKRLWAMRKERTKGIHVGAYGWVLGLSRRAGAVAAAGYIHAPSLGQACTAAVLASAHQTHPSGAFAVDLSSERVRAAKWLLDGVRRGQPVGALLGYRFERWLHEAKLDMFIDDFRSAAPLVAGKIEATTGATETIAARNVVDGLLLAQTPMATVWPKIATPRSGTQQAELEAVHAKLLTLFDAVGDVLLAESTHRLVQGSPEGAAATIEALGLGQQPPSELEVIRTPRTGIGVTHRVALLFGGVATAAVTWPRTARLRGSYRPLGVRAAAEPNLDAWCATILGPAQSIRCDAVVLAQDGTVLQTKAVSAADLAITALDLVYGLTTEVGESESDIERRFIDYASNSFPLARQPGRSVRLVVKRQSSWAKGELGLTEVAELARAIRDFLAPARPLSPADLLGPGAEGVVALDALKPRWDAARAQAQVLLTLGAQVLAATDVTAVAAEKARVVLLGLLDFGVPGAAPRIANFKAGSALELREQCRRTLPELVRRLSEADAIAADDERFANGPYGARLEVLFGDAFHCLPVFARPAATRLGLGMNAATWPSGANPSTLASWLERAGRVRPSLDRLQVLQMYTKALGGTIGPGLSLFQSAPESAPWAATAAPSGPVLCTVGVLGSAIADTASVSGLVVDEWPEVIPSKEEVSGVAFHYDAPDGCAPQALLLALPADRSVTRWTTDALASVVRETIDLAKVRSVDLSMLRGLGQFLPALYFPTNTKNDVAGIKAAALWE